MLVTLSIASILTGIALVALKELDDPLKNGSSELVGFLKQARARAISTTSAYWIYPTSNRRVRTKYANKCSDTTQTVDDALILDLPTGATLPSLTWSICYNARGLPVSNVQVQIQDNDGRSKIVEVYLGGAVQVY